MIALGGFGGAAPSQPPIIVQSPAPVPTPGDAATSAATSAAKDAARAAEANKSGRAGAVLTSREGIPTVERPKQVSGEVTITRPKATAGKARIGLLDDEEMILPASDGFGATKKRAKV